MPCIDHPHCPTGALTTDDRKGFTFKAFPLETADGSDPRQQSTTDLSDSVYVHCTSACCGILSPAHRLLQVCNNITGTVTRRESRPTRWTCTTCKIWQANQVLIVSSMRSSAKTVMWCHLASETTTKLTKLDEICRRQAMISVMTCNNMLQHGITVKSVRTQKNKYKFTSILYRQAYHTILKLSTIAVLRGPVPSCSMSFNGVT